MGLAIVEIFMEIEEEFDVTIADEEASRAETVGQLCELVRTALKARGDRGIDPFPRVQKLISDELGLPIAQVTPNAHFVRDLGCD